MPSDNQIIIAAAGSGKTTAIINDACQDTARTAALITYTINGRNELRKKAFELYGAIPPHVTIMTWYNFLLRHCVRPYQNLLDTHGFRTTGINFIRGRSARGIPATNVRGHYFTRSGNIHLDKVSKFACNVNQHTDGKPLARIEAIFDRIFIDESQDLAGWDLELVELFLHSNIQTNLVGDHRQATYSTNDSGKNSKYFGVKIIDRFSEWEKADIANIIHHNYSYRCVQAICDLADGFHPVSETTESYNGNTSEHDGAFAVLKKDIPIYLSRYSPQVLRYSRATKNLPGHPMNFGQSKGMTFNRTLIFPHGKLKKYLNTGDINDAGNALSLIYVAITRARQSVGFVVENNYQEGVLPIFTP